MASDSAGAPTHSGLAGQREVQTMSPQPQPDGSVQEPSGKKKSLDSIQKHLEPHEIDKLGNKNIKKTKIVQKSYLLAVMKTDTLRGTAKERRSVSRQFQLQPPYLPQIPLRPLVSA